MYLSKHFKIEKNVKFSSKINKNSKTWKKIWNFFVFFCTNFIPMIAITCERERQSKNVPGFLKPYSKLKINSKLHTSKIVILKFWLYKSKVNCFQFQFLSLLQASSLFFLFLFFFFRNDFSNKQEGNLVSKLNCRQ